MSKANETMQAVAERLIASIEEGLVTGEWQKPWSGGGIAMNAVTGNQYSGANLVALWIYGEEFGRTQTESEFLWLVDPIDGTRAFLEGRIKGESYCLILHLTDQELKASQPAAS